MVKGYKTGPEATCFTEKGKHFEFNQNVNKMWNAGNTINLLTHNVPPQPSFRTLIRYAFQSRGLSCREVRGDTWRRYRGPRRRICSKFPVRGCKCKTRNVGAVDASLVHHLCVSFHLDTYSIYAILISISAVYSNASLFFYNNAQIVRENLAKVTDWYPE